MKITIKEVAKLVGVSPSTVSRVISDSPRISDETKTAVREAMEKLGYHPNAIARSLVNRSTNTLGIVMSQSAERAFLNPFFPQALSGISAAAHEEGYCMLLSTGNSEDEQLESIESIVRGGRVDGVIIMYSAVDNIFIDTIKKFRIPIVIIGKPLNTKELFYVDNDNAEAASMVTKKLLKKGHKKIGFICGSFKFMVNLDRLDGYRKAVLEYGIEFEKKYIKESSKSITGNGYLLMKELLELKEKPSAVIVTDDIMAFGAIDAIKEEGFKVPEDIEVISFNNVPLAEFCNPSLTSVEIQPYQLGYESSKLLIEKIKGTAERDSIIVPTKLVVRESSF